MSLKKNILKTLFVSELELVEVRANHYSSRYEIKAHRNNDFLQVMIEYQWKTEKMSLSIIYENGWTEKLEEQPEICKLLLEKTAYKQANKWKKMIS